MADKPGLFSTFSAFSLTMSPMNATSGKLELYGFAEKLRNQQRELQAMDAPVSTVRSDQFLDTFEPTQFPHLSLEQPETPLLHQADQSKSLFSKLWNKVFG